MDELGLRWAAAALVLSCASCLSPGDFEVPVPGSVHGPFTGASLAADGGVWTTAYPLERSPSAPDATVAFDEVLPSWNVDLPEGSSFRVEVAVARAGEVEFSPWLDIGGWGPWPVEDRAPTEFDGGQVKIDVLVLEEPHHRARFRLRTLGGAERDTLHIADFRAWLTLRERIDEALEFDRALREQAAALATPSALAASWAEQAGEPLPDAWPPEPLELRARHQYEVDPELGSRICSPTSVAMVLEHHGVSVPTREVADLLYDAEHDIYGNWNRAVQGAYLLGVPGHLSRLSSWRKVMQLLAQGRPLVVTIGVEPGQLSGAPYTRTDGHLIVIVGLDLDGNALVLDPATPAGDDAPRRYALDELEVVWMKRGGVAYVLGSER